VQRSVAGWCFTTKSSNELNFGQKDDYDKCPKKCVRAEGISIFKGEKNMKPQYMQKRVPQIQTVVTELQETFEILSTRQSFVCFA
jgi:hypothetical protein